MENQKITKLLNKTYDQPSKLKTREWLVVTRADAAAKREEKRNKQVALK